MVSLPQRKVGIIACSGEELAEGTVTRLAALKVLHELRPGDTVTICLPLFLAGGEADRSFARFHPTITVDGCGLKCAAHGTERYSAKPAASLVVTEMAAEDGLTGIEGRRCLNPAGQKAVDLVAERLAALVDQVLGEGKERQAATAEGAGRAEVTGESEAVGCSCGSGVPVKVLTIAGQSVEVIALPLILDKLHETHSASSATVGQALLEMVKIYNYVTPGAEDTWREVLTREFAAYCARRGAR